MCDKLINMLASSLSKNCRCKPQGSYAQQTLDLRNGRKLSLLITCGQVKYYFYILFLKCVSYSLEQMDEIDMKLHNLDILHVHCSVRTTCRSKNFTLPTKRNDKHNIYL